MTGKCSYDEHIILLSSGPGV